MDAPEVILLAIGGVVIAALVCWGATSIATRTVRRRRDAGRD
jgi:hypothetical protein